MGAGVVGAGGAAIVLSLPVLLAGLGAAVASADATPPNPVTLGPGVPDEYREDVLAAAALCPRITPSLLAAQIDVESGWHADAVSPAGAMGLAQFMPGTWASWGGDLDEDGQDSPLDPGDALRAQARYLCHLLDVVLDAGLGGDHPVTVIGLALAAYNAGPGAVLAYRGVPPYRETQNYVGRVFTTAASSDYALGVGQDTDPARGDVPAGGVDAMLPAGYRNGRTSAEAVDYALSQVGVWRDAGYCLRFVARYSYQRPPDGGSIDVAHQVWAHAPASLRHARDFTAPRGAVLLWDGSIGGGAGHIAISLGGGKMVTTTRGAVGIRSFRGFSDGAYLGWMPPYFRSHR